MTDLKNNSLSDYEIMLILIPDLGEEGAKKEFTKFKKLISSFDGEIYHEDVWGLRDLEFVIKKQNKGFYIIVNVKLDPNSIKELNKELYLNSNILRFLLLKTSKNYEIHTLEEYKELEEKALQEKEEKNKKKEERRGIRKTEDTEKPKKVEEKQEEKKEVTEKVEEPKKEEEPKKVEETEEKVKKEKEEQKLEEKEEKESTVKDDKKDQLSEVDEKLKNIIYDPDITL